MTESEFLDLINKPGHENENLEFKEAKTSYSPLGSKDNKNSVYGYCVAIGNELGGYLILGVDDNKIIVGSNACQNITEVKEQIFQLLKARIEIKELFIESKRVVIICIPRRKTGDYFEFYGMPLMRVGQELRAMDKRTIGKILNETEPDWSSLPAVGASVEDINSEAIKIAKENFSKKYDKIPTEEIESWDTMKFLEKTKLVVDGKITNSAIILLGKENSRQLISPSVAQITWSLIKGDEVIDYEHFFSPLILSVEKVYRKIRNLKYRYIRENLFPEEIDQYDRYVIREALNNCIAHQDYQLNSKITVVEKEDSLIFTNSGFFLPGSIENVISKDAPPRFYRNKFLSEAMVNLNMIDTVGSGIKRMFKSQSKRFFPLPTYDLTNQEVQVEIIGKVLDINYARLLAKNPNLSLKEIMLLDFVQKNKNINKEDALRLKKQKYIEGRYPNIYISEMIAKATGEKATYIKNKAFETEYYEGLIIKYLKTFNQANKKNLEDLLFDKFPNIMTDKQKSKKISNILSQLSKKKAVVNMGNNRNANWILLDK